VLRIVPECRDRVAVVVAHDQTFALAEVGAWEARAVANSYFFGELVHQAVVEGGLLVGVIVILIAGHRLGAIQSKWLCRIGILIQQAGGEEAIYAWRVIFGVELRLTLRVGGVWIGREIVIE